MGARFDDLTFVLWRGDIEEGATLNPKICNTEKYDNSLYKGSSN
jgi:hypothetical protein